APEQLRGEPATPASDIYAYGILLHELFTGELPFGALPLDQRMLRVSTQTPPSFATVKPGLALPLVKLVDGCLALDPAARPRAGIAGARTCAVAGVHACASARAHACAVPAGRLRAHAPALRATAGGVAGAHSGHRQHGRPGANNRRGAVGQHAAGPIVERRR